MSTSCPPLSPLSSHRRPTLALFARADRYFVRCHILSAVRYIIGWNSLEVCYCQGNPECRVYTIKSTKYKRPKFSLRNKSDNWQCSHNHDPHFLYRYETFSWNFSCRCWQPCSPQSHTGWAQGVETWERCATWMSWWAPYPPVLTISTCALPDFPAVFFRICHGTNSWVVA